MPSPEALAEAGRRLGATVEVDVVASNELLEERMAAHGPYDLVCPSDYLVARLRAAGRLRDLDGAGLPLDRLAGWALEAEHDPGCRVSVPLAFGTTGYLCGEGLPGAGSWRALLEPGDGVRVGMLDELREVVGAALIALGHSPNATGEAELRAARELLERQRPQVVRYDSDDFVGPVAAGEVAAHHAWSGPASRAVRADPRLRYVVPAEGAILWITSVAIPVDAPDPDASLRLVGELMDPVLAAITTTAFGYATPNVAARALLAPELRHDPTLFPDDLTLRRCHALRDLGAGEALVAAVWSAVTRAPAQGPVSSRA
jgi:spermidine/putrescine-binding protein